MKVKDKNRNENDRTEHLVDEMKKIIKGLSSRVKVAEDRINKQEIGMQKTSRQQHKIKLTQNKQRDDEIISG